jgi:hypothetical protein
MTTEAKFPPRQICLKPSLYGRFSLDHLWPLLGDHRGLRLELPDHLRSRLCNSTEVQKVNLGLVICPHGYPFATLSATGKVLISLKATLYRLSLEYVRTSLLLRAHTSVPAAEHCAVSRFSKNRAMPHWRQD